MVLYSRIMEVGERDMNPEPKIMAAIMTAVSAYIQQEQGTSTMSQNASEGTEGASPANQKSTRD